MKIKACYSFKFTNMIEILFEDFPYDLFYKSNWEVYWVGKYEKRSQFQKTKLKDIPEKVLQDISDPLFELKCLQEMANPEKNTEYFTESHDFSF